MEAAAAQTDPMLERAWRLGALGARLPALPVHDWLDRAAAMFAEVIADATILTLLISPEGDLERIGAGGPGEDSIGRDPQVLMRRIERLPPAPRGHLIIEPAPPQFIARLAGRFAEAPICLMAAAPLADADARRLLVLVACDDADSAEMVLALAMGDLAQRALVALGPACSDSAPWLLPGDLQLIEALVDGKTIPEIARETHRKEYAVQDAVKAMYRRLGRNRRTDLVARAVGHVPASEIEAKKR